MGIPGRIGKVRPFAELARGTTTSVLKAHDSASNQVVVVKLLRREWAQDEAITARFVAESTALQSVSNDNVVQILDHGDCEDGLYIITEFVEGQTLEELISDRTVPTILGAFIVREALVGLAAVHEAGIIHRDFKSANIVVGDSGIVKLMDFGFAESPADSPAEVYRTVAGTLGYIAPELLSGEGASVQSDVFAAGVTLLEATTGVRSRDSVGVDDRTRHATKDVGKSAIGHIDPDLAVLIRQMSEATPGPRTRDAASAIEALDAVLATYRPAVITEVLRRWIAGERQTLPRKLLNVADDGAITSAEVDAALVVQSRNVSENRESRFTSPEKTPALVDGGEQADSSSGTGKFRSSPDAGSSASAARARIRKRRAGFTVAFLMGSLLIVTVARQSIMEFIWPEGNGVTDAATASLAEMGTVTANPDGPDVEDLSPVDVGQTNLDGKNDGIDGAYPPGGYDASDTEQSTRDSNGSPASLATNLNSPAVTDDAAASSLVNPASRQTNADDSLKTNSDDSLNTDPLATNRAQPAGVSNDGLRLNGSDGTAGVLLITASPWAHVTLDGERIGTTPFSTGVPLTSGRHTLVFSNPSFPDLQKVVDVVAGDSTPVAVSMWSTVARLSLEVSPWAEVLIDGIVRDTIPMSAPLIIPPGLANLTLRHPELGSYSETITFEADSSYIRRYNLFELTER